MSTSDDQAIRAKRGARRVAAHSRNGDRVRLATACLTPGEHAAVKAHPRFERFFLFLDIEGPDRCPRRVAKAAKAAGVSPATLWRLCIRILGCTYLEFVSQWRTAVCHVVYGLGECGVRQVDAAIASGFYSVARMRAAFVRWTRLLPTGEPPRRERLPLFAGAC